MAISGIYKITCRLTGKIYIGSSINIEARWEYHKSRLSHNMHYNRHLQRAWNKYGENNFNYEIVEVIKPNLLAENELKWFKITDCCNHKIGFNIADDPKRPMIGRKHTNETKLKMSLSHQKKFIIKRISDSRVLSTCKIHGETPHYNTKIRIGYCLKCNEISQQKKKEIKKPRISKRLTHRQKTPKIKQKLEKFISFENTSIASKEHFIRYAKENAHILEDKEIVRLYVDENRSCGDISLLDGRCESTIYKILLENNIKLRDRSEANKIVSDEMLIKLYNLGLSLAQVGILVGVNPTTISKRFTLIGFPTRISCQARNVKYTKEEFKKFFMNDRFKKLIQGSK